MTNIVKSSNTETMTTIQLREMINEARAAFGEVKVRNDQLLARIEDELEDELGVCKTIAHPQSGVQMRYYDLTLEQCTLVGMRESKGVRRSVLAKLKELEAQQKTQLPDLTTDIGKLLMIQELTAKQIVLVQENQHQAKQIESLQSLFQEGMTVPQFCKQLNGVNVQQVNTFLKERNWLFQQGSQWRVAAYARDKYLTEHQNTITQHGRDPFITHKPVLLKQGAVRLHELYLAGELPMKKSWNGQFTHDKESLGVAA